MQQIKDKTKTFFGESIPKWFLIVVDFSYNRLVIASALAVIFIYLNFHEYLWAPYILAPCAVIVVVTLVIQIIRLLYDYGCFRIFYGLLRFFCRWIFGQLQSWFTNKFVVFLFSLATIYYFYFTCRWIWINIDIFRVINSTIELFTDMIYYIADPNAIMVSVVELLDDLHVRTTLDWIRIGHIDDLEKRIQEGDPFMLLKVFAYALLLVVIALLVRAFWEFVIIQLWCYISKAFNKSAENGYVSYFLAMLDKPKEAHIIDGEEVRDVIKEYASGKQSSD
jgi:hypothetical protein